MASIFRTFLEKLGGSTVANYIGKKGDLFFDPIHQILSQFWSHLTDPRMMWKELLVVE